MSISFDPFFFTVDPVVLVGLLNLAASMLRRSRRIDSRILGQI